MGAARIALLTRGVAYLRERGMSMGCGFAVGTYHVRMRLSRQRRLPCLGVPIAFRGVLNKFATPWRLAGGSPAASYLLCLAPRRPPKKVTEERRPRDAAFLRRVPTKIGLEAGNLGCNANWRCQTPPTRLKREIWTTDRIFRNPVRSRRKLDVFARYQEYSVQMPYRYSF